MPDISIKQAISRATEDVLEKMFFTRLCWPNRDEIEDAGPRITVRLAFDGERRGLLALGISKNSARTLAADFLGTDTEDGPDETQVNEVVRELANMICGDASATWRRTRFVCPYLRSCRWPILSYPKVELSVASIWARAR